MAYTYYKFDTTIETLPRNKKETYILLQNWFSQLLQWSQTSEIGIKGSKLSNNIGSAFDVTIASIAHFVGQTHIAKKILYNFKQRRIDQQIQINGAQPKELARTNSISYSIANLRYMMDMQAIAKITDTYIDFNKVQSGLKWLINSIENLDQYQYKQISGYKYLKKIYVFFAFVKIDIKKQKQYFL